MSSYNKFVKSNVSKLGFEIARSGGLTQIMAQGAIDANSVLKKNFSTNSHTNYSNITRYSKPYPTKQPMLTTGMAG